MRLELEFSYDRALRDKRLKHQLAEDVGASHPPHLRWARLAPTIPSIPRLPADAAEGDLRDTTAGQVVQGSDIST